MSSLQYVPGPGLTVLMIFIVSNGRWHIEYEQQGYGEILIMRIDIVIKHSG